MSEWQPIATAPKDGTPIDLWISGSNRRFADCRFHRGMWQHWWMDCFGSGMDWQSLDSHKPTHWMPLPTPPTEGSDA
jgi:hypothetical protein